MVEVSTARQLRLIARAVDRQALTHGRMIREQLGRLPVADQIRGLHRLVRGYASRVREDEERAFQLYRSNYAGRQKPGELDWQGMMLDSVSHDSSHLREDIGFQLEFWTLEHTDETISPNLEQAVGQLVKRAGEYLVFANYPLRIMAALSAQQECLAPAYIRLSLKEMFDLIALSGIFRAVVNGRNLLNFQVAPYCQEKAADPAYVGIMT